MATFNPEYWEIATDASRLDRFSSHAALWFETEMDRERRYAMQDFYRAVSPVVRSLIDSKLTGRQREILRLYYIDGKTQEDIADLLSVSQSTVSRHLFGTVRSGKKVGGAIPKLRKAIDGTPPPEIERALVDLRQRLARAS